MSAKRVRRNVEPPKPDPKPSKLEYAVAKYMRQHVPVKKTKFMYHTVEYFSGARAVDVLLQSPWASGEKSQQQQQQQQSLFVEREDVVKFLDTMLQHKFFHRARKIAITEQDLRRKQLKKLKQKEEQERKQKECESGSDEEQSEERVKEQGSAAAPDSSAQGSTDVKCKSPKAKKADSAAAGAAVALKRRVRLDMHLQQQFVDSSDAFVWIYAPVSAYYWLLGATVLLAAVAVCLFPLWPVQLRQGVYYLSLAGGGFLLVILVLTLLRTVLFLLLWLLTMGRHHLWLLPNLTEDVGFFASFWPLYKYEYHGQSKANSSAKSKKSSSRKASGAKVTNSDATKTALSEDVDSATCEEGAAATPTTPPAESQTAGDSEVRQRRGRGRPDGTTAQDESANSGNRGESGVSTSADSASSDSCSHNSSSAFEIIDRD